MSSPTPPTPAAVFLSYAREDSEAARLIADALRRSGVEVWFDQAELHGGDAWDAKIRRQIKDCALFVPVISANTQARPEGYFRLEWRLAVERSRLMADDQHFFLPAVIDDTTEQNARVPDEFRGVQWTRLKGDESRFADRVVLLLRSGSGPGNHSDRAASRSDIAAPRGRQRRPFVSVLVGTAAIVAVVAIVFHWLQQTRPTSAETTRKSTKSTEAAPSTSERDRRLAEAWRQLNKAALGRAELEIAEEQCRRILAANPDDADALATASTVDSWFNYFGLDRTPARREGARAKAARALTLAPESFEARLAYACFLVRGAAPTDKGNPSVAAEAEKRLVDLRHTRPADPRVIHALAIQLRNADRQNEAIAMLMELAQRRDFAALAWDEIGWIHYLARPRNLKAAEDAVDRSIAVEPYWGNLSLKLYLALGWRGDVALAKSTVAQLPAAVLQEDNGALRALEVYYYSREPEKMLQVLNGVPRDWFATSAYFGPKALWSGIAHQMAGRAAAAEVEWQSGLRPIEQRLAEQPNSGVLLRDKARLLAHLGAKEMARKTLQLAKEIGGGSTNVMAGGDPAIELLLGNREGALDELEKITLSLGTIRLNPAWDELRNEPRFRAIQARVEAAATEMSTGELQSAR